MAFIAIEEASGEMLGVVRLHANANYDTGEYAILVRSDMKGRGLGWLLMQMIIDYAHAEGLQTIEGQVLRDNTAMLTMCRELGFEIAPDPRIAISSSRGCGCRASGRVSRSRSAVGWAKALTPVFPEHEALVRRSQRSAPVDSDGGHGAREAPPDENVVQPPLPTLRRLPREAAVHCQPCHGAKLRRMGPRLRGDDRGRSGTTEVTEAQLSLRRAVGRRLDVVVVENAQRGAVEVVVLAARSDHRKAASPVRPERQRHRHEIDQHVHGARPRGARALRARRRARSALSVTRIEEPDIAAAAISGVTKPAIAIGTAIAL